MKTAGFTLLEVLVALAIAATALVALMGRLGSSADIQQDLSYHALALATATNLLEEQGLEKTARRELHGKKAVDGVKFTWRSFSEKTDVDGFVRFNVEVTGPDGQKTTLFVYRMTQ